jgi:hypothetical protein
MKSISIALALCIVPAAAFAEDQATHAAAKPEKTGHGERRMQKWAKDHGEAAKDLEAWMKADEKAAVAFFEWEGHHPKGAKQFVHWSIEHKDKSIEEYETTHAAAGKKAEPALWVAFDKVMNDHKAAATSFMEWARKHPEAAQALMKHAKGLLWAGTHIAKVEHDLETHEDKPTKKQ